MTEAEWLADPANPDFSRHVRFIEDRLSPRKLRLLAAAFCRTVWALLDHADLRAAVEVAERFADGAATGDELEEARQRCRVLAVEGYERYGRAAAAGDHAEDLRQWLRHEIGWATAFATSTPVAVEGIGGRVANSAVQSQTGDSGVLVQTPIEVWNGLLFAHNRVLRAAVWDVVGNPFHPPDFAALWRTGTAVAIARGMYDAHDFSAMPILADALQDAGCHDEAILGHCRESGEHVRGCWVVDLVLGHS